MIAFLSGYCDCKKSYKPVSDSAAKKYLQTFGYVGTSNMLNASPNSMGGGNVEDTLSVFKKAIKKFQEFAGLLPTGQLDEATKTKMAEPRCGVVDVMTSAFTWDKTDLTYSIESFSTDLPREEVRDAIAKAYKMWSDVTPLNFREVPSNGDIRVKFGAGSHGDPWPFDGSGGVLAHATFPKSGYLHFDEDEDWAYKDHNKLINYQYIDLLSVAIHEAGHTLGLEHSRDKNAIMAPFYQDVVDRYGNYVESKLARDDIEKIQDLYGLQEPKKKKQLFLVRGTAYLFSSTKVYEIQNNKVIDVHSLKQLFPNGPPYTQGAFGNRETDTTYLFHDRKVYSYKYDDRRRSFKLENGYPKRLPFSLKFNPMGAFRWSDNQDYLFNANDYAVYNDEVNGIRTQGRVPERFKNFPRLEAIRGKLIQHKNAQQILKRFLRYT
ncbi:unnamed protein product [Enterobius vermicularis]|uniref:ZnMc domain-containing protein n=1 Tax=Enterobius vermicularis TaxID=51028 RepID=A0A0N4V9W1_ENTVE|nr:unnamed protein product [Enterobius vermicularis]